MNARTLVIGVSLPLKRATGLRAKRKLARVGWGIPPDRFDGTGRR